MRKYIILFIITLTTFVLSSTNKIYAQACDNIRDCPSGTHYCDTSQQCTKTITIPGGSFTVIVGCCAEILEPGDPNYRPGFYLPLSTDIEELNGFKFNWAYLKSSIGPIISSAIPWIFGISGLLLFFYLLYGAFLIVSALGNSQKIATGRTVMTQALFGYALLASTYWIGLIASTVLGINFGIR